MVLGVNAAVVVARVFSLVLDDPNPSSFAPLLSALRHGAPPHGGIAFGTHRRTILARLFRPLPTSSANFPGIGLGFRLGYYG